MECTYSIVHDEHHENGFTITENSLRMMNSLIQWMTWNHMDGHCWYCEKLLWLLGQKLLDVKAAENSTGLLIWVLRFIFYIAI